MAKRTDIIPITLKGDELNDRFGGGIPKNSLILIEGDNGMGKSVMAQRLVFGLTSAGASFTYLSTELNTAGFVQQMESFNYKVKKKLFNNEALFLSLFPSFGSVPYEKNFFKNILETKEIFQKDVIVFDTMSHLLVEDNLSDEMTFNIIKFLKELTSLNKIIIFCVNPKHLNENFLDLLKSVSDIYFRLEQKEQYGVIIKLIHIERFTGAGGELSTPIPYKVLAGLGLALEIASTS